MIFENPRQTRPLCPELVTRPAEGEQQRKGLGPAISTHKSSIVALADAQRHDPRSGGSLSGIKEAGQGPFPPYPTTHLLLPCLIHRTPQADGTQSPRRLVVSQQPLEVVWRMKTPVRL